MKNIFKTPPKIRLRLYFPKLSFKFKKTKILPALIILAAFSALFYYKTPEVKTLFQPKIIKLTDAPRKEKTTDASKISIPENIVSNFIDTDATKNFDAVTVQQYTDTSNLIINIVDAGMPPRVLEKLSVDAAEQIKFFNAGMEKYFSRNWRGAIADFMKVIEFADLKSDYTKQSYLKIADAYFQLEDYQASLKFYDNFIEVFGDNYERIAMVYHNIGVVSFNSGNFEKSGSYFERALAKNPAFIDSYIGLANYHLNFVRNDNAIDVYRRGLARQPKNVELNFNLGYLLFHLKKNTVGKSEISKYFDEVINNAVTTFPAHQKLIARAAVYNYLLAKESADYQNAYNYLLKMDNGIYKNRELAEISFLLDKTIDEIERIYKDNIFADEPYNIDNYIRLADKLYNMNLYEKAMGYYARALKINDNSVAGYFGLGRCAFNLKIYNVAYNAFARIEKKILPKNQPLVDSINIPDDKTRINFMLRDAYNYLGFLSAQKNDFMNAVNSYKNAMLLTDATEENKIAEFSFNIAIIYHKYLKNLQLAEKYYVSAAAYKTDDRKYEKALGAFYFSINSYRNALDYIGRHPRNADEMYMIAYSHYKEGDFPKAIEVFENIINVAADNPIILNASYKTLGNISFFKYTNIDKDKKEIEKAIEYFNNAIRFNDKDDISYFNAGLSYFQIEDYNKSINYIKSAIDIQPLNSKYYSGLANCYFAKKMFDLAEEFYKKAIDLDKANIEAQYNLMRIREQKNG